MKNPKELLITTFGGCTLLLAFILGPHVVWGLLIQTLAVTHIIPPFDIWWSADVSLNPIYFAIWFVGVLCITVMQIVISSKLNEDSDSV